MKLYFHISPLTLSAQVGNKDTGAATNGVTSCYLVTDASYLTGYCCPLNEPCKEIQHDEQECWLEELDSVRKAFPENQEELSNMLGDWIQQELGSRVKFVQSYGIKRYLPGSYIRVHLDQTGELKSDELFN